MEVKKKKNPWDKRSALKIDMVLGRISLFFFLSGLELIMVFLNFRYA
jgi:hypothetical protein